MTMGICPIDEIYNAGTIPHSQRFLADKSPWSKDLKWISLSKTMEKCPFSIFKAL
jgi:hypothetical protein